MQDGMPAEQDDTCLPTREGKDLFKVRSVDINLL